jgi:hypothetical protein
MWINIFYATKRYSPPWEVVCTEREVFVLGNITGPRNIHITMPNVEYEAELLFCALRLDSLSTGDLKQTGQQLLVSAARRRGALARVWVCRLALQVYAICQCI